MEELSPLTGSHHMLDNFRYEGVIFFFGILLVEDAILLIAESDTAKYI